MNLKDIKRAIEGVTEEKGIDSARVLEAIESSIAAAYKKEYEKKGEIIKAKFGDKKSIPVIYGGSVKPQNAFTFLQHKEIEGCLIGGSSINFNDFCSIIKMTILFCKAFSVDDILW